MYDGLDGKVHASPPEMCRPVPWPVTHGREERNRAIRENIRRFLPILYSLHAALLVLAFLFHDRVESTFILLPLLIVPAAKTVPSLAFALIVSLLYDAGLIALFTLLLVRRKYSPSVAEPKAKPGRRGTRPRPAGHPLVFLGLLSGYGFLVYLFLRHHTLFFTTVNGGSPEPLFGPVQSLVYSLGLLVILAFELTHYASRFAGLDAVVGLVKNLSFVLLLGLFMAWPPLGSPLEAGPFTLDELLRGMAYVAAFFCLVDVVKYAVYILRDIHEPQDYEVGE